ncbi:MAG: hypothetical protein P8J32_02210 [bacterium]|nr:hypothetical protein [bacterium]
MSSATLRHHNVTLSFLPYKKDQRISRQLRTLKLRTSRRRTKQLIRNTMSLLGRS